MSRASVKSRESLSRRRRRPKSRMNQIKPFYFCCTAEDVDPLTIYDQRKPPYSSSMAAISPVQESPALKFRTHFVERLDSSSKKLGLKVKNGHYTYTNSTTENLANSSMNGPIRWYVEEELALGKDILWADRLTRHNEVTRRNIRIGRKNVQAELKQMTESIGPRWYQDFSLDQLKNLLLLEDVIRADYKQMITGRTQKTLLALGVFSTFFKIDPRMIRRLQRSCDFKAIDFLREAYRLLTGNYFEEEGYKNSYDCNERIILSAIAFLTLPETVVELHKRLPAITMPTFPPKPVLAKIPPIQKMSSPYLEKLFTRADWSTYLNRLQRWRDICRKIPIPLLILPREEDLKYTYKGKLQAIENDRLILKKSSPTGTKDSREASKREKGRQKMTKADKDAKSQDVEKKREFDIPRLPDESKVFDFTLSGLSEKKAGPVQYKICGTLNPPRENKKSWLGDKHAHFVITGVSDDPPQCPVSYEMTGVANVTPTNSNERFFTVLKIGDGDKKIYPQGRSNLSKNWQEWLLNADEEFMEVEREANRILKSVEATMRLVFPGPTCDNCCSCRQTRKTDIIRKETKAPYMVIDTLTEDDQKQKYIVGSMALHSPAPTPHESTVNLLEIIASEDKVTTNVVINGVTDQTGERKYYITGMKDETIRIPSRRVEPPPPLPPKNVPPCSCAIQQMFNQQLTPKLSTDNIPWTKDEGQCLGKKYRPEAAPAYSCRASPGDKSCRLNPFLKDVARLERKKRERKKSKDDYYMKGKKRMYSIADFQPCGDEHGMSVCGGPWGTRHILSPQELADLEKQRKEILKGPPCGTRPGRAVCGGPFGERIPEPKKARVRSEDDEEDEEDEEEIIEEIQPPPVKEKVLRRDKLCHASPESIAASKKLVKKKVTKFIPDPDYPGYDDPWNIFRTAPSVKETDSEYEKSLRLSSSKPRTDKPLPIRELMKKRARSKGDESIQSFAKPLKNIKSVDRVRKEIKSKPTRSTEKLKKRGDISTSSKKDASKRTLSQSPRRKEKEKSNKDKKRDVSGDLEKKSDLRGKRKADSSKRTSSSSPKRKKVGDVKERSVERKKEKVIREKSPDTSVPDGKSDRQKKEKTKKISKKAKASAKNGDNGKKRRERRGSVGRKQEKRKLEKKSKMDTTENLESSQDKKPKKKRKKENDRTHGSPVFKTKSTKSLGNRRQANSKRKIDSTKAQKAANVKKSDKGKSKTSLKDPNNLLVPEETREQTMERLKKMMMSPDTYPHEVNPAVVPKDPPGACKHEYDSAEKELKEKPVDEEETDKTTVSTKGPCGWRTKSEQELPVKKTMAYLADPDPPLETIPVRPGGRACICRENRNKKKILMYQIGGSLPKKKVEPTKMGKVSMKKKDKEEEEDRTDTRVIDGVIYYTPPPSRRRSDEYVPEYDLYKSPYEICADRRKDSFMNMLEKYTAPRDVMDKIAKKGVPCDCSGYMDTFGVVGDHLEIQEAKRLLEEREKLMESKEPKERWQLALKDQGLMDYYAGCKHKIPCWSTCKKLNAYACPLKPRRLTQKKPVCECKYERKIVEKKEEKIKWRERRQKLRTYKKQPFVNVADTSRPMEADTKLIISGVKRIPRKDEYIDDVQYCISGVAENYTMGPATQVVAGLNMSTPFHTPEPSKEKIPCVCLHSHWSQSNIPPGPLPRKDEALIKEREERQKYLDEMAKLIYGPHDKNEESQKWYRSCHAKCEPEKVHVSKRRKDEKNGHRTNGSGRSARRRSTDVEKNGSRKKVVKTKRNLSIDNKSPSERRPSMERKTSTQVSEERRKDVVSKVSTKREDDTEWEDVNEKEDQKEEKTVDIKTNLAHMVKVELKKMAEEGFLFAKLPMCHRMPQLRNWIMYRKGIALTKEETDLLMRLTLMTWEMANVSKLPKIVTPTLRMSMREIRELTFDMANKMKRRIALKNSIFYSQLRKTRVLFGRSMWSTMEYRRYPAISFKKAYFTYIAAKEADGHVFKPWAKNEVREKD